MNVCSLRASGLALAMAAVLLAACSKEKTLAPVSATPSTPLVEQSAADPKQAAKETFRGSYAPGGIAATYQATFIDGQIQSLEETRKSTGQTGTYEFQGARLLKYRGHALKSNDNVELEFDLQGKLLVAKAGDKEVSRAEISAIRERAQSLRSHAVAKRAVKGHDQP